MFEETVLLCLVKGWLRCWSRDAHDHGISTIEALMADMGVVPDHPRRSRTTAWEIPGKVRVVRELTVTRANP